jgi:hypothetical protein
MVTLTPYKEKGIASLSEVYNFGRLCLETLSPHRPPKQLPTKKPPYFRKAAFVARRGIEPLFQE